MMHFKTILNRIYKFKRFVYGKCYFNDAEELIIELLPLKNSQAFCGRCKKTAPVYDHLTTRKFEFIPKDSPIMQKLLLEKHGDIALSKWLK
jgi:hypothetical protein